MTRSAARTPDGSASPSQDVVIVVAVYNNEGTILDVLGELETCGLPIIVIDDGSDDGTRDLVESWSDEEHDPPRRSCRITVNKGKAAAMRAGFDWAMELGFTHALTFDADGQHDVSRVGAFLREHKEAGPGAIVLGSREPLARTYPMRNRIGRLTSNVAVRAHCGLALGDVPCGMRIYPLECVRSVRCISGRYAWEEEFVSRAVWAGASIRTVRIPSVYAPAGKRVSHYRFRRDWAEGIAIFLWLLVLACVPAWKVDTWRRHARVFLCVQNPLFGRSMAAGTERLFLAIGCILTVLLVLVPLPFSWVVFVVIAWLGLAWNLPGILVVMMIAGYLAGFGSIEVASLAVGIAGVCAISLLVSLFPGFGTE